MADASVHAQVADTPALDVNSILEIHREPDGFIAFAQKTLTPEYDKRGQLKTFIPLFSIRTTELRAMIPGVANWLAYDSYFSVNSYYRAAPYESPLTGLPGVVRKEKDLRYFTACYCDVDCGRPESTEPGAALEWPEAVSQIMTLTELGKIPTPSILARSGRGAYVFWLLQDEHNPGYPERAWPEKLPLYKLCNRELNARLRAHSLPADKAAIDAARILRVPGSVHSKTGRRVFFVALHDKDGRGFIYTLSELARLVGVAAQVTELPPATRKLATPPQYRKVKNPGSAPLRSSGYQELHALRAQDLLTIQTWRGGFIKRGQKYNDGTHAYGRRKTLALYCGFLRGAGESADAALTALRDMAAKMIPPYPSDSPADDPPIESIVREHYAKPNRYKWSNDTLCKILGVTADVAREYELKTIRPKDVALEADKARPLQADIITKRQDFARDLLKRRGRISSRSLAEAYLHAGFPGANRQTANEDLNAIGYVMNRARAGRKRKALKVTK